MGRFLHIGQRAHPGVRAPALALRRAWRGAHVRLEGGLEPVTASLLLRRCSGRSFRLPHPVWELLGHGVWGFDADLAEERAAWHRPRPHFEILRRGPRRGVALR